MGSLFVALLVPALLSAEPSALVVLSRKVSVPPAEAAAMVTQTTSLLLDSGAPLVDAPEANRRLAKLGLKDATTCAGKPACAAEFGKQLKVDWLVLLSVSRVAGDRSLALELFDVAGKTIADRESLILPKGTALTREALDAFAGRLKARLLPPPPTAEIPLEKKTSDAPLKTELTPQTVQTPPPLPPAEPKGHAASWILGGTGVAAIAAGVVLMVIAASTQAQVTGTAGPDGRVRSSLSGSQAQAAAGTASVEVGVGAAAAAVGLGLGATAVVLW
jgi:hypothetical protein